MLCGYYKGEGAALSYKCKEEEYLWPVDGQDRVEIYQGYTGKCKNKDRN